MNSYHKFIILSAPRSGSNYLAFLLNDHPKIISYGEFYDKRVIWSEPGKLWIQNRLLFKIFRDLFPVLFLKLFIFHWYPQNITAVGFRLFCWHVEQFPSVLRYLLHLRNFRIIILKRRNLLKSLVSLKLLEKNGIWISLVQKKESHEKITLSYRECVKYFINIEKYWETYDRIFSSIPKIEVFYEDLSNDTQKELAKILKFLEVPYRKLSCPLKKQNTRSLRSVIRNYQGLKNSFSNSRWNIFFD